MKGEIYVWDFDDAFVKNIIDISKDVWGGRKISEKFVGKKNNRIKFFNSINYNLSGNLLLSGGNSNYVCIYDMNYYILIKKICVTYNQNLDGILYKLNSKKNYNNNFNDSEDEIELKKKIKNSLPGENNFANEIKINSVQFSNTNREFAVGCTEGIFVYSLDKKENYFNLNLDVNVTIEDCVNLFHEKKYLKAIIYSIYLNKLNIFEKFLLSIDVNFIESIVKKFPVNVIESLVNFFCAKIENNNNNNINKNIELLFKWIFFIVKFHGEKIKGKKEIFLNVQKTFNKIFKGIENVVKDNIYTTKFLIEYENEEKNNQNN
jgi:periodic tryptophan protein 2